MRTPEAARPERWPWGRLELGEVLSHQPYTGRMDVRLKGAGSRVIRNVLISPEEPISEGDWVLLARVTAERRWMMVVRLPRHDEYGYEASATQAEETELHPPANFAVHSAKQHIVGTWDAWPGAAICFQTQIHTASNVDDDVGDLSYTFGNVLVYQGTPGTTYYARVRAVRFDTSTGTAHGSAWTSWASGEPLPHYGTEATRVGYDTTNVLYGTLWVESDTSFTYLWNGSQWVPVDVLRVDDGPPDTATLDFGRLASQAIISVLDDEPSALRIVDDGSPGEDYLTIVSTDTQREVVVNQQGADIDFRAEAVGIPNALRVQAEDGHVDIAVLLEVDFNDVIDSLRLAWMGW